MFRERIFKRLHIFFVLSCWSITSTADKNSCISGRANSILLKNVLSSLFTTSVYPAVDFISFILCSMAWSNAILENSTPDVFTAKEPALNSSKRLVFLFFTFWEHTKEDQSYLLPLFGEDWGTVVEIKLKLASISNLRYCNIPRPWLEPAPGRSRLILYFKLLDEISH